MQSIKSAGIIFKPFQHAQHIVCSEFCLFYFIIHNLKSFFRMSFELLLYHNINTLLQRIINCSKKWIGFLVNIIMLKSKYFFPKLFWFEIEQFKDRSYMTLTYVTKINKHSIESWNMISFPHIHFVTWPHIDRPLLWPIITLLVTDDNFFIWH